MTKGFDKWMARAVRVKRGPFAGEEGVIQMYLGSESRVRVMMAARGIELWFKLNDLKLIGRWC